MNNIEQLVNRLEVDLYTEVIGWNEMRDLQLSFFKSGVPHIDTPQDHAFFAPSVQICRQIQREAHSDRRQLFNRMHT